MLTLRADDLHWLDESELVPKFVDYCAHGRVTFSVGDHVIVSPGDGDWNVTGASLYLLRTLARSHTRAAPVATDNFLIPSDAHVWYLTADDEYAVVALGLHGIDLEVLHEGDQVRLRLESGIEAVVTIAEWRDSVLSFADEVRSFHDRKSPNPAPQDEDDRRGWEAFWVEWRARRNA